MGKANLNSESVVIKLSDPGMTALHKVGLAGLWMTLKAFDKDPKLLKSRPPGAGWRLDDRYVTLTLGDKPQQFLGWLVAESFKLDDGGLFWFPALGRPRDHIQQAVVLQGSILGTFLQHGNKKIRVADPATKHTGSANVTIDDKPWVTTYRKVKSYAHQRAGFSPGKPVSVAGWLAPGGTVRHTGLQESTALEEPLGRALALAFALPGAVYFEVKTRGKEVRAHYAVVLPEVTSLSRYALARERFVSYGVQQLYAAGTADAGMRVLAELHAADLLDDVRAAFCRVVSFGVVPWSTQQKTRVNLMDVRARSRESLKVFMACRAALPPKLVRPEDKDPFWDVPLVPDLVAANLSAGREWFSGFADLLADKARREHVVRHERGGLTKMTENKLLMPEGPDKTFVLACQEALRRHMGKKHGRPGGADWGTEYEKVRVGIARCKNAATLRESITDFWSRGGTLHRGEDTILKAGDGWWQQVLPLFDEKNWRRAKDLALLALASYPAGKKTGEQEGE